MTPTIPDDLLDSPPPGLRRRDDQPSLARSLGLALAVVSIAGSVFAAGYNWRSVSIVEGNQSDFVRKDVQREQLNNITERLAEISRQLEQVRGELEIARRRP